MEEIRKINPSIFRAYDIRGIYGKDLREEIFQKIGFVLGRKKENFLIGHDIRKSGKSLSLALISGLRGGGAKKVFFCGKSSFGLCLFSGLRLKVDKTLFITASHLPKEWNGLKISFGEGLPISSREIQKIKEEVLKIKEKKIGLKEAGFEKVNLKKDYISTIFQKFPLLRNCGLKIVVDCGNGAVSLISSQLFKKFGFKIVELFCRPDPLFPHRPSEPTFEATKKLRETVLKEKADFGVAFDGDGDRGVIIDDKGRYLSGNEIGVLLGKEILKDEKNKKIVKTVACSMSIEEELKPLGAKIFEVPVGHTFVISAVKKKKAILGIEESSHIVLPQYFLFDDAILIPLKIAEILIKNKKRLSQLIDEIKIYPFEEIVFPCEDEKKFMVIEKLRKEFKKKYKKVNDLDGLKVYFDFGWVLIRVSNTSPKIRLYLEAKRQNKLAILKDKFSKILKKCIQQ